MFGASPSPALAQQQPAAVLAKSANNSATGAANRWDFSATDLSFKAEKKEVWVIDAYSSTDPTIVKFSSENLPANPTKVIINLPQEQATAPVLGIAEIPHGIFKGKNLILVDSAFGTNAEPRPEIAIYGDDGSLEAGETFAPLDGLGQNVGITSLDVNPVREEIVAYDDVHHSLLILDFGYGLVGGPFSLEGFPNNFVGPWFYGTVDRTGLRGGGVGVAYTDSDHVVVTSSFRNQSDCHWALEYNLTSNGAYSSRAIDLSQAGSSGLNPDLAFAGCTIGKVGNDSALFALNTGDDSLYAFRLALEPHAPPVALVDCSTDAASGLYTLSWTVAADPSTYDGFAILENGVTVATLGPTESTYTSSLPTFGRAILEVATQKDGLTGGPRLVCETNNSFRPALPDVLTDATQITSLGVLSGLAVEKMPSTAEEFRGYVIGQRQNDIEVFDHTLAVLPLEKLTLNPRVVTPQGGSNLSAIGIALVNLNGEKVIAVLDPDGPTDSGVPSAGFYSLAPGNRGVRIKEIDPIDLGALTPVPFLFDWDSDSDNHFVAGGSVPGSGDFVLVRILFDGETLVATQQTPIPQRQLTPFSSAPLTGVGLSVLPSGNLLVAGSDTFSRTYTEALLMSPFVDAAPGRAAAPGKFVGYAQGLPGLGNFMALGSGLGPSTIYGLETAYFPPESAAENGIGITYLPTGSVTLLSNPSTNQVLTRQALRLIHGTNACAQPDLLAEQLLDSIDDLAKGASSRGALTTPSFAKDLGAIDYFLYVINQSQTASTDLTLEVLLDGAVVTEASHKISLPPGRYFRRWLPARSEDSLQINVTNSGKDAARVRVITGAMGTGSPPQPRLIFRRGDCDTNGVVNLTDAIFGLNYLFKGGVEPTCADATDTDDDGKVSLTDMIQILNFLFKGGGPPMAPGAEICGLDPTDDGLSLCDYPACK